MTTEAPSPWRWRLHELVLPAALLLGAVLAMCWPIFAGKVFTWDALWEYWGDLTFQADALRAGQWPLWNPFDRLGYPFHADPQAGTLYPVNWPLAGAGALLGHTPVGLITLKTVLHFFWAAFGMFVFLRHGRGLPRWAALAGGLSLLLGFSMPYNLFSALNWSFAWAPWVLFTVERWAARPVASRAAALAVTSGCALLAGAYAAVFYTAIVAVPYGLWAVVHHGRRAPDRRAHVIALARSLPWFVGLLLGLTVAQLLATSALVPLTVREVRDAAFLNGGSLAPGELAGLLVPRWPTFLAPYLGVPMLLAAGCAVALEPTVRRLLLVGCLLLAVLCAASALTGALPVLAEVLPPFGFFRRPHRYLYVAALVLAILGAEGLAALAGLEARRRRRVLIGLGAVVAAAVGVWLVAAGTVGGKDAVKQATAFKNGVAAWLVAGAAVAAVVLVRGRWQRVITVLVPLVLAVDLYVAHKVNIDRGWHAFPEARRDQRVATLAGVPDEVRIYDREYLDYRPGIRLHLRDLGGYEGDPLALTRYQALLEAGKRRPRLLGHANVRWLLQAGRQPIGTAGLTAHDRGVHEVPVVAPRVQWLGTVQVVPDQAAALATLTAAPPGTLAVLESGAAARNELAPVTGRVIAQTPSTLTAEVDAPAAGVVVITEAFAPGWSAEVDGAPAEIVPANVAFRGIAVGPGRHVIAMRYQAPAYLALAWLVPLALLVSLLLGWRARGRKAATI
jgi:hypothetical protein